MNPIPISHAVTPLRMIFWGGLLCILDFSISSTSSYNGQPPTGFKFDILNDFLGMILIMIGVHRLSRFAVDPSFKTSMRFVLAIAVFNGIEAFWGHFIFQALGILILLSIVLGVVTLWANIVFCTCMYRLSSTWSLRQSAKSWLTTRSLMIIIWALPLGVLQMLRLVGFMFPGSFSFNIGFFFIPVLLILTIPLFHLFVSTSRMRSEAEAGAAAGSPKGY